MGDFKGLADRLKTKEIKYVMEAGKLKIGKGVISYDENIVIPLGTIILAEIPEQERTGICSLKIENYAGMCFYITALDMNHIREIRSALIVCMGNGDAVYSGPERAVAVDGQILYGDQIIDAGGIHIVPQKNANADRVENKADRMENKAEQMGKKTIDRAGAITILDDEWKTLEEYSLQRMKDFGVNERNHTICEAMAAASELKNREKCKMILDVSGNDALDMIIAGAPIAVKAIVNKLM